MVLRLFVLVLLAAVVVGAASWDRCTECERDSRGHIKRSPTVVKHFRRQTPCPYAAGNCIADHKVPLACATSIAEQKKLDVVSNLQWQTKAAAKAKDLWEMDLCEPWHASQKSTTKIAKSGK